ncbi:MAG TPA: tRNA 2-thiouridine(34) synthase MnmA [Terriglobales bacterium]|nr:tRNA 2-thiouridine(34) synthase MnmA [Terriglobales bacterium]
MHPETIAVAMSGGVDSSAVAAMLRAEGRSVIGLTMQLWNQRRLAGHEGMPESVQGRCCSIDDVHDARRVAETLGIPYYVVNHEERFERDVVRPFVEEYLAGRTPIPCSLCNNHLKFDQLLIVAQQIGADKVATGHYAQVAFDEDRQRWLLKRPADRSKDQTYFLFGLTQEQLSRTLFPLGGMTKPEVRELARKHSLVIAEKPDSQEICFVPGGDYKRFIEAYLSEQGESQREIPSEISGEMVTTDGKVIGEHAGVHNFTVGQRKGLGVATGSPLYVIQIKNDTRQVVVGKDEELYSRTLVANRVNLISTAELTEPMRVTVKIRHKHQPAPAMIEADGAGGVRVTFDEPQRALTPGQAAVFYDGDIVVGGGWIENPA